ncbi:MAG: hypothetical protein ABJO54_00400, partial [Hyphomicrobiales bacterium]
HAVDIVVFPRQMLPNPTCDRMRSDWLHMISVRDIACGFDVLQNQPSSNRSSVELVNILLFPVRSYTETPGMATYCVAWSMNNEDGQAPSIHL